jgi:DNA-binding transcriptional MerR regulator
MGFQVADVIRLTGINRKTLHYWDQTGFLRPSISSSSGTGSRRIYGFQDVVAVRVALQLRKAGISLQAVRRLVKFLRSQKSLQNPLAENFLLTDGTDVYLQEGEAPLQSVLRNPGQGHLFMVDLNPIVAELRGATKKLSRGKRRPSTRAT